MFNPYAPPKAQLELQILDTEDQGTLQGGIDGQYDFSISTIIAEGWEKTKGAKGTFWLAYLAYGVIVAIVGAIQAFIFPNQNVLFKSGQYGSGIFWYSVLILTRIPFTYPILAGISLLGIRRSVGADIQVSTVFKAFAKTIPITLLGISMILIISVGYVLLIIPGIYLSIAYLMSFGLMMDRDMDVWEALETSRKAIAKHWFKIFFLYLMMAVMFLLACLPVFIGLIWMLPLLSIVHGILYKKMFGVASVQEFRIE
jgi:hypothetical protein